MKAVVQRVRKASVSVNNNLEAEIDQGLLILVGIGQEDTDKDAAYLADKIISLRIFEDDQGRLDKSLMEVDGDILAVPNFTLYGDCSKGRRPSFAKAAGRKVALTLFDNFIQELKKSGLKVEKGTFGAYMQVKLINNGPVTLMVES